MSTMSEIATELQAHWLKASFGYWRRMPDQRAVCVAESESGGWWMAVGGEEVWQGESLYGAVFRAGEIAREQLDAQKLTWT